MSQSWKPARGFQDDGMAQHVRIYVGQRGLKRVAHAGLGGEMNHDRHVGVAREKGGNAFAVAVSSLWNGKA